MSDDTPIFGFRTQHFKPKTPCSVCGRKVYVGIVNITQIGRRGGPTKVVCRSCAASWDEDPKGEPDDAA